MIRVRHGHGARIGPPVEVARVNAPDQTKTDGAEVKIIAVTAPDAVASFHKRFCRGMAVNGGLPDQEVNPGDRWRGRELHLRLGLWEGKRRTGKQLPGPAPEPYALKAIHSPKMKICLTIVSAWLHAATALAQDAAWKFPCPTNEIARYTAPRITETIRLDGKLDERAWQNAPASPRFVDILSGQPTLHDTRAMVVWDEENFYVAYRVEEPKLHAKYQKHNDPIYYDNDVELFIAGPDGYYEFEINGYNTVYEVFFIWEEAYEKRGFAKQPEFARARLKPFNGVGFTQMKNTS